MGDGVPKIISFAYNNQIAELKMENCGKSLKEFMCTVKFMQLSQFHKACLAFDMLRQILKPLSVIHTAGFVHGDMKPDNICI